MSECKKCDPPCEACPDKGVWSVPSGTLDDELDDLLEDDRPLSDLTVACVLKTGGDYDIEDVMALRAGLVEHMPPQADSGWRFACLTDAVDELGEHLADEEEIIPLLHDDWRRWWAKLELFNPATFQTPFVLYLDLDTLPVGDLERITATRHPFAILSDFYRKRGLQSAVMLWQRTPFTAKLYYRMAQGASRVMRGFRSDQEYIERAFKEERLPAPLRWQSELPKQFVSLKVHAHPRVATAPPPDARLVCAHGQPRLSNPKAGWAHKIWRARCPS